MTPTRAPRNDTTCSLGLDTTQYLTPHAVPAWSAGCRVAMRYIRRDPMVRDTPDLSGDWLVSLSHQELAELLAMDWMVGLVQIGSRSALATAGAGGRAGAAAGANALALRAPKGTTVFCDCEWATMPSSPDARAYLVAWCTELERAGKGRYMPGLYVTPDLSSLRPEGLYRLPFRRYWYSATCHSGVAVRGPSIVQTGPHVIGPGMVYPVPPRRHVDTRVELLCDLDVFRYDHQGGRVNLIGG